MAITLLNAPQNSLTAIEARLNDGHESTKSIKGPSPVVMGLVARAESIEEVGSITNEEKGLSLRDANMVYPHVRIDLASENPDVDLKPYAWQHIYRTGDDLISLEVADGTEGDLESVAIVSGPRLNQTVKAVSDAMDDYRDDPKPYVIKVLHLRSMAFRAVILEYPGDPSQSLAIPLPPAPRPIEAGAPVNLLDLIATLRELAQSKTSSEESPESQA